MNVPTSIEGRPSHRVVVHFSTLILLSIFLLSCGGSQSLSEGPPPLLPSPAATSYVDCSAATNGNGTQANPWNTLVSVSATTFNPGDQILFNRAMSCSGMLAPQGSGTASSPIVIEAYGTGPQPIIDGGTNTAAVQLVGQQGWEINNLEIIGGNRYGVYISGNAPNTAYTHFRLTNLDVHGAHFISAGNHDSAEVLIVIGNAGGGIAGAHSRGS